jgi:hypothetical protein
LPTKTDKLSQHYTPSLRGDCSAESAVRVSAPPVPADELSNGAFQLRQAAIYGSIELEGEFKFVNISISTKYDTEQLKDFVDHNINTRDSMVKTYPDIEALFSQNPVEPSSIQKVKTFTPPSSDEAFVFSQLSKNIENATMKARRYNLAPRGVIIYLRSQDFNSVGLEVKLSRRTAIPNELIEAIRPEFRQVFQTGTLYRSTGVVLANLEDDSVVQLDLFGAALRTIEMKKLFLGVDKMRAKYGKHTLYLGSSHLAQSSAQHSADRGDEPLRERVLLKGETKRRRLGIPMFLGKVT